MLPLPSLLALLLIVLAPTAAADISIAGGAMVIHEDENKGATVAGVGSARILDDPNCYDGLVCLFIVGESLDENYFVLIGGGPHNCGPQPSDCAVVFAVRNSTGALVQVVRHDDLVSVCAIAIHEGDVLGGCYGVIASANPDPAAPGACAGAGEQTTYTTRPDETCDGLYVTPDPLCVERQSDGFDVVCQT